MIAQLFNGTFRYIKWQELKRLEASIKEFELRWELRKVGFPAPDPAIIANVESAITKCKETISINRLDKTWRCLNIAMIAEIQAMDRQALKNRMIKLENESGKISKWRYESIIEIFKQAKFDSPQNLLDARQIVSDAQDILLEYANNEYFKIRLRSNNMNIVMLIGMVVVGLLLYLLYHTNCKIEEDNCIYFFVVLMGILGGAFSVMQRYIMDDLTAKIPMEISNSRITISRPFIGAASAFIAYIFFKSGFILPSLMSDRNWPFILLSVCFLSGFSERFIVKIADGVINKK